MPKTITDIIPPSRRKEMTGEQAPATSMGDMQMPPPPPPRFESARPRKRFPMKLLIAAGVVVLLAIGVLLAFGGAKVEATPVARVATVSSTFSATPSAGDLPYQVITAEALVEKKIKAEGTETADIPAQGMVTIYNGQSKTQELIKNTRFSTSEGLIFRIRDSVRVPAGTEAAPGQLQVTVYADAGGASYNIGPATFSLPGLKGSATYDLVYAKSEEPMKGGFTGTRPSVGDATRTSEYDGMKAEITKQLTEAIEGKIPEGYVLLTGASYTDFVPEPDGDSASDSVNLREKGVATALVFPKESLARAIAFASLGVYGGQPVTIRDASGLTLTPDGGLRPVAGETISFTLSGTTEIVWIIDPEEIRGAIAGKSRDAARTILAGFSEIEEARLILKPFWEGQMPADPTKIEVEIEEPKAAK